MFNDFSEILKEFLKKLLSSRLVILAVVFVGLYAILGMRLFNLQIRESSSRKTIWQRRRKRSVLPVPVEIFMTETGMFLHIINCRTM